MQRYDSSFPEVDTWAGLDSVYADTNTSRSNKHYQQIDTHASRHYGDDQDGSDGERAKMEEPVMVKVVHTVIGPTAFD
jgi:hypothetical protein